MPYNRLKMAVAICAPSTAGNGTMWAGERSLSLTLEQSNRHREQHDHDQRCRRRFRYLIQRNMAYAASIRREEYFDVRAIEIGSHQLRRDVVGPIELFRSVVDDKLAGRRESYP